MIISSCSIPVRVHETMMYTEMSTAPTGSLIHKDGDTWRPRCVIVTGDGDRGDRLTLAGWTQIILLGLHTCVSKAANNAAAFDITSFKLSVATASMVTLLVCA